MVTNLKSGLQSTMTPCGNLRASLKHHHNLPYHYTNAHLNTPLNIPQLIYVTQTTEHFSSSRYFLFAAS